jgi:hypothetical protein
MKYLLCLCALPCVHGAAAGAAELPLVDKTLVAWVCLAGLDQRAGSVLTVQEKEAFDAIVFAERRPGAWMAGSDFFRRTQGEAEQAAYPRETADPPTPVQVAVVYQGNTITLYRNGQRYAGYTVGQAQPFGAEAIVLIGLRYLGTMGEIGFLQGAVAEARIYAGALSSAEVAALTPVTLSGRQPLAWWTFAEGSTADLAGTFTAVRLVGDAHVEQGRLHLAGDGYLVAARDEKHLPRVEPEDETVAWPIQTAFFKPRAKRTGNMWDTWLYHRDGIHYLYTLANSRGQWDNISLATSPDGVHWQEVGPVLRKGRGVTWMGTGSTWQAPGAPAVGRFQMNFSEWKGPRQTIFFAASEDLVHWTRLGQEYEFVQDERWYEPAGRWDCIWTLPRPGGGLYGYWTATPKPETGGRFGFGETLDGVTWQALPPPRVEGVGEGEVGAVEPIGTRFYMMFGSGGLMVTLVADRPEGPFVAARKNPRLLSGHTYFSRFYRAPDGLLVNHHSVARDGQVYFGTLKGTAVDEEGTLRLVWWRGNEALKHERLTLAAPVPAGGGRIAWVSTALDVDRGVVVEGTLALPAAANDPPAGLYIECRGSAGVALLVFAGGRAELGPMQPDGSGFQAEKAVDRERTYASPASFRLLLKQTLLEVYLDDVLIECYSLPQNATGRIGGIGGAAMHGLSAWQCE